MATAGRARTPHPVRIVQCIQGVRAPEPPIFPGPAASTKPFCRSKARRSGSLDTDLDFNGGVLRPVSRAPSSATTALAARPENRRRPAVGSEPRSSVRLGEARGQRGGKASIPATSWSASRRPATSPNPTRTRRVPARARLGRATATVSDLSRMRDAYLRLGIPNPNSMCRDRVFHIERAPRIIAKCPLGGIVAAP
jgi:hypothetical protein